MRTYPPRRVPPADHRSPGRRAVRPLGALLMGAVLAAGAVGCGSESADDGADRSDSKLGGALMSVPAPLAGESMMFRDVTTARRLVAADRTLYRNLAGYGIPELNRPVAGPLEKDYGFTEKQVRTSLNVGSRPTTVLAGSFDADAISRAMTARQGYRATGDDAGVHLKKQGSPTVDASDAVRIERDSADAPAVPLAPPAKTVSGDGDYRAVTGCLGEVYAATLYGKHAGENKDVVLLGIGAKAGEDDGSSETLCALTTSQKGAEATAGMLRKETGPGGTYEGAEITVGEGDAPMVSMTWQNKAASGLRPGDADKSLKLPGLVLKLF